jgi:uncharacterized protein with HEPN domain
MKDDTVYLKHIADAIVQIEDYLHEKSFEEFTGNKMCQDAVVRYESSLVIGKGKWEEKDPWQN